jgi:hypothetical protein
VRQLARIPLALLAGLAVCCGAPSAETTEIAFPATTASTSPTRPPAEELTKSFSTANHLITIHYPADFTATPLDVDTVKVARSLPSGVESLRFRSITDAVSTDPQTLADDFRKLADAEYQRRGIMYTHDGRHPAQCLGKYDGVQLDETVSAQSSGPVAQMWCFFAYQGTAFVASYNVPKSLLASDAALLDRIQQATDVTVSVTSPIVASPTVTAPTVTPPTTVVPSADVDGANLTMANIEADGLVLKDLTCKVDGGIVGGLFGGIALAAGLTGRKMQLDACSPSLVETRVKWVSTGGHMTHVTASGSSMTVNRCVEHALAGAPSPMAATCATTVRHGHP